MSIDFSDFAKGLKEFRNVFTVKKIITMLFVAAVLVVTCSPQHSIDSPEENPACDVACPMREVITIPTVTLTEVAKENWQFDLPGDGWEEKEGSNPVFKAVMVNKTEKCMVLFIKEATLAPYHEYATESIKGFIEGGAKIKIINQVVLNKQNFIQLGAKVPDDDVLWSWNTIKDGFGYSLNCFCSSDAGPQQRDMCASIADSLQIK